MTKRAKSPPGRLDANSSSTAAVHGPEVALSVDFGMSARLSLLG
jgi:hypothetical protein